MRLLKNDHVRIFLVSPLDYTGHSYYSHSLARALSERGIDVCMATTDTPVVNPGNFFKTYRVFIETYGERSRFRKGLAYAFAMLKIIGYAIKHRIGVIHFQILDCPEIDVLTFFVLKLLLRKIVWTPHDVVSLKGEGVNKYFKVMYRLSDMVIVHNNANLALIERKFGVPKKKIKIIPHGNYNYFMRSITKDEARQKLNLPMDKKILLIFGNLRDGKGIETSFEALRYLDGRDDYIVLVAGKVSKGFDFDRLIANIHQRGLDKKVILRTGFISDDLVEYYYKSADICLVPYQTGYESGVLRYAFSCCTPVIASDLKEFSEILQDKENSLICKSGDPIDLAKKIECLLDNAQLSQKLALNAKEISDKDWGWEKIADITMSVYSELL